MAIRLMEEFETFEIKFNTSIPNTDVNIWFRGIRAQCADSMYIYKYICLIWFNFHINIYPCTLCIHYKFS